MDRVYSNIAYDIMEICITSRDWLLRKDKTPEGKLGRRTIVSLTAEEELEGELVHVQQMGFGITIKQVLLFTFKICEERNILQRIC
jgi:hypothetical protein